jgi:hypothetical protein
MKKIIITTEMVNAIAEAEIIRTHIKRAEKAIKRDRVKELIADGVDKEIAQVMASVGL